MTPILLTGKNGQVGWELRRTLAPLGAVRAFSSAELDLAAPDTLRAAVRELKPRVIVNAAAYTAVDAAESDAARAHAVNATAPGVLAEEAKRLGALLVHYSTDYVFDGTQAVPYREDTPTAPLNVYGASKAAGEEAIRAAGAEHLILRTSWVYGGRGKNFLLTVLRLAREREELRMVADQTGAPTWSRAIAEATAAVLAQCLAPGAGWAGRTGTYHLAAGGETTWHGFTRAILDGAGPLLERLPRLAPIATHEYPLPARRPVSSRLDCSKLAAAFGVALPDWRESLALCLEEMSPPR